MQFTHVHVYAHADVSLSSDFIAGFCGETEEEHCDTISLLDTVKFDMAYMFAYSMRKEGSNLDSISFQICCTVVVQQNPKFYLIHSHMFNDCTLAGCLAGLVLHYHL